MVLLARSSKDRKVALAPPGVTPRRAGARRMFGKGGASGSFHPRRAPERDERGRLGLGARVLLAALLRGLRGAVRAVGGRDGGGLGEVVGHLGRAIRLLPGEL